MIRSILTILFMLAFMATTAMAQTLVYSPDKAPQAKGSDHRYKQPANNDERDERFNQPGSRKSSMTDLRRHPGQVKNPAGSGSSKNPSKDGKAKIELKSGLTNLEKQAREVYSWKHPAQMEAYDAQKSKSTGIPEYGRRSPSNGYQPQVHHTFGNGRQRQLYYHRKNPEQWPEAVKRFSFGLHGEYRKWRDYPGGNWDNLHVIFETVDNELSSRISGQMEVNEVEVEALTVALINQYVGTHLESLALDGQEYYMMMHSELEGEGEWLWTPVTDQQSIDEMRFFYGNSQWSDDTVSDISEETFRPKVPRSVRGVEALNSRFQAATEAWKTSE